MKEKIRKFDKIFNCQKCDRTLWLRYWKLPDGRAVCPMCYNEYGNGVKEELKHKFVKEEKEKQRLLEEAELEIDQKLAEVKEKKEKMKRSKAVFFNGEYIGNCIVENGAVFNFHNEYMGFVSESGYFIDSKLKPVGYVGKLRE